MLLKKHFRSKEVWKEEMLKKRLISLATFLRLINDFNQR
jgi:hypothetical protein